jgi:hypothetical protein
MEESKLLIVDDVWDEFVRGFETGDMVHDQIFIVSDNMLLRGPNHDLIKSINEDGEITPN